MWKLKLPTVTRQAHPAHRVAGGAPGSPQTSLGRFELNSFIHPSIYAPTHTHTYTDYPYRTAVWTAVMVMMLLLRLIEAYAEARRGA